MVAFEYIIAVFLCLVENYAILLVAEMSTRELGVVVELRTGFSFGKKFYGGASKQCLDL